MSNPEVLRTLEREHIHWAGDCGFMARATAGRRARSAQVNSPVTPLYPPRTGRGVGARAADADRTRLGGRAMNAPSTVPCPRCHDARWVCEAIPINRWSTIAPATRLACRVRCAISANRPNCRRDSSVMSGTRTSRKTGNRYLLKGYRWYLGVRIPVRLAVHLAGRRPPIASTEPQVARR